mgnify:CR=1 FL=1
MRAPAPEEYGRAASIEYEGVEEGIFTDEMAFHHRRIDACLDRKERQRIAREHHHIGGYAGEGVRDCREDDP